MFTCLDFVSLAMTMTDSIAVNTIIFVGPTLAGQIDTPDYAVILPPAGRGDLIHAWRLGARRVLLIDGVFEQSASVWHKEIEFCLSQGVQVVGAASMGALRAAELSRQGMIGYGEVFAMFRDGLLRDDDEVAVLHAGSDLNWLPVSHAMVDIRCALEHAVNAGAMTRDAATRLLYMEKTKYFGDRYLRELDLSEIYNSIKRSDALGALRFIETLQWNELLETREMPFNWSTFFERLWVSVATSSVPASWSGAWLPKHEAGALVAANSVNGPAYKLYARMAEFCRGLSSGGDFANTTHGSHVEAMVMRGLADFVPDVTALREPYARCCRQLMRQLEQERLLISRSDKAEFHDDAIFMIDYLTGNSALPPEPLVEGIALLWSRIDREARQSLQLRGSNLMDWSTRVGAARRPGISIDQVAQTAARCARLFAALGADTRICFERRRVAERVNWLSLSFFMTSSERSA